MTPTPDRFSRGLRYATESAAAAGSAPGKQAQEEKKEPWVSGTPAQLARGLVFGLVFGFLLQKGGVAKFDILIGVLLLEEFTVVKVMVSAVVVGMVGAYALNRLGLLELQVRETVLGANLIGGLIFGVGFGLIAYCPGTDAAAVGQGNLDALVGVLGLIVGSYLFALTAGLAKDRLAAFGKLGKKTWPQLLGVSPALFIAVAAPLLILALVLIELFTTR